MCLRPAHIDHSGRLPLLVRQGFHGPILSTPATRDLCALMLADSANIQMSDANYLRRRGKAGPESEPLYDPTDAAAVQQLMVGQPYRRLHHLRKHPAHAFTAAGPTTGAASVDVRCTHAPAHRRRSWSASPPLGLGCPPLTGRPAARSSEADRGVRAARHASSLASGTDRLGPHF